MEGVVRILLAHGSSDQAYMQCLQQLADRVSERLGEPVRTACLDDPLPQHAQVLPLLLACGEHWQRDVPAILQDAHARRVAAPAEYPADMADMLQTMAIDRRKKQRAVLFALYSLTAAEALTAELYRVSKRFSLPAVAALHGCFAVSSVLDFCRVVGLRDVLIQPALLFPGHSLDRLHTLAEASGINVAIGDPLAVYSPFADWLAERFRETI